MREQRRQYILDRVGPRGVSYVIDFNVNWMDPGGESRASVAPDVRYAARRARTSKSRTCSATSSAIRSST